MSDSPRWVREYTSGDLPVTFDAAGGSRADWVQALGAGTVSVTCEDGSASTLTLVAGQALPGPFRACGATTASRVRFGRGDVPTTATSGALYVATADLASTSAALGASLVGVEATGNDLETDLAAMTSATSDAQTDATQALADAAAAQSTADDAVPLASVQTARAAMVAGSVTFATLTLTAGSIVVPMKEIEDGAASGLLTVGAITPGAPGSVTITSADNAETSTIRVLVIG